MNFDTQRQHEVLSAQTDLSRAECFLNTFDDFIDLIEGVQAELITSDIANYNASTIFTSFSQLKDAVGVVRVFVAAALVMTSEVLSAVSDHLRGTLVVALHKQRACAMKIRASAPRKLLSLVEAGFSLPPELSRVQMQLEADFSVGAVRDAFTVERWWELATAHIDKLHSLQATLLLELERNALHRLSGGGISPSRTPSPAGHGKGAGAGKSGTLANFLAAQLPSPDRATTDDSGADDAAASEHSASTSSGAESRDWLTLWGEPLATEAMISTGTPAPPPRRSRNWPKLATERRLSGPDEAAAAAAAAALVEGKPSSSRRGSRDGSRHTSRQGSRQSSRRASPRVSRNNSMVLGATGVIDELAPSSGGKAGTPPPLTVNVGGGDSPFRGGQGGSASSRSAGVAWGWDGGERARAAGVPRAHSNPARLNGAPRLGRAASYGGAFTAGALSGSGLASSQKGEELLRAAASMLVLGPASARGGGMSAAEVRSSLLNTSPAALVQQLVMLLDEGWATQLGEENRLLDNAGSFLGDDSPERTRRDSGRSPLPSPTRSVHSNPSDPDSPVRWPTEGAAPSPPSASEPPAGVAVEDIAQSLQGSVTMELPAALEQRTQRELKEHRKQQQQHSSRLGRSHAATVNGRPQLLLPLPRPPSLTAEGVRAHADAAAAPSPATHAATEQQQPRSRRSRPRPAPPTAARGRCPPRRSAAAAARRRAARATCCRRRWSTPRWARWGTG